MPTRFRAVHEEAVKVDMDFGSGFSGVLADKDGQIRGLWASYSEQVMAELCEGGCQRCMCVQWAVLWVPEALSGFFTTPHGCQACA